MTCGALADHPRHDWAALEVGVLSRCQQAIRRVLVTALEHRDDPIGVEAAERIRVVCKAERRLTTPVGRLTVCRRYVQDQGTGRRFYSLDAALGLAPRKRLSPWIKRWWSKRSRRRLSWRGPAVAGVDSEPERDDRLTRVGERVQVQQAAERPRRGSWGRCRRVCVEYLPGPVLHHLAPCHLRHALRRACGQDPELLTQVSEGLRQRDWAAVDQALTAQEGLRALRRYLAQHWAGITTPDAPSQGASKGRAITGWPSG